MGSHRHILAVTVISTLVFLSGSVRAADTAYGPFIRGGIGFRSTNLKTEIAVPSFPATLSSNSGKTSFAGQLGAGYAFDWQPVYLAACFLWEPRSASGQDTSVSAAGFTYTTTTRQTNRYAILLEPGGFISPSTVLYAKISYNFARGEASDSLGNSDSTNFHGFGGGVGIKHMLKGNLFVYSELEYVSYQSKTFALGGTSTLNIRPTNAIGMIGVGVQF
jgi:hypothetical protein